MSAWQIETGTAHGRGFSSTDAAGLLAKFTTWIVKAPASGGPGWFIWDNQSAAGTDPYIVVCDVQTPVVNDLSTGPSGLPPNFMKLTKVNTDSGFIRIQYYLWWNNSTHVGYGIYSGFKLATYDDADFEYRFRGGAEGLVLHTRLGSTWYGTGCLEWEGTTGLVEGTDKYGVLQSSVTAGSNVVLSLASGQENNFTVDKYYYLYDFVSHTWCNYVKVTAINTGAHTITINACNQAFPSGAVIAAYAHRVVAFGNWAMTTLTVDMNYVEMLSIPYQSSYGYEIHSSPGVIYGSAHGDILQHILANMIPDDEGNYATTRPLIYEYCRRDSAGSIGPTYSMNRAYGQVKNIQLFYATGKSAGSDGVTVSAKNYVYLNTANIFALGAIGVGFLDTASV